MNFFYLIVLLFFAFKLQAQFAETVPVKISDNIDSASYSLTKVVACDSGFYVTWYDESHGFKMHMQYLDPKGNKMWDSALLVTDEPQDSWVSDYSLITDGSNAYVFYSDARNGDSDKDIFGHKINSSGSQLWGTSGVPVVPADSGAYDAELEPYSAVMSDESIVVAWSKMDANGQYIVAQRLNSNGGLLWGDGYFVKETGANFYKPRVNAGENGNVYISYIKQSGGMYGDRQILVNLVNANMQDVWNESSIATRYSGLGYSKNFSARNSSHNGIYLYWQGDADKDMHYDAMLQYVSSQGDVMYGDSALFLENSGSVVAQNVSFAGEDVNGNPIVVWSETDAKSGINNLRYQVADTNSNLLMSQLGKLISTNVHGCYGASYNNNNLYSYVKNADDNLAYMNIYNTLTDSTKQVFISDDVESFSAFKNGEFVAVWTSGIDTVSAQNVYYDGSKGIEAINTESKLAEFMDIADFRLDSNFYYKNIDSSSISDYYYKPMNIYQNVNFYSEFNHALGNYIVTVSAFDSTKSYYQYSLVNNNEGSDVVSYSSDCYQLDSIDTVANIVRAKLAVIKGANPLFYVELSPGARLYYNNNWDPLCDKINSNVEFDDSVEFEFDVVGYEGTVKHWKFICSETTSITKLESVNINIFPNPVNDILFVKAQDRVTNYSIINYVGSKLFSDNVNSKEFQINTNSLQQGVYFVRIATNNSFVVKKFIVKK